MAVETKPSIDPQLTRRDFIKLALFGGITATMMAIMRGANPVIPVSGAETLKDTDVNDPNSKNYRGYHTEITMNKDSKNGALRIVGKIPYLDRFNALGEYNIQLLPIAGETFAQLAGGKGVMRVGAIMSGDTEVGRATIFYLDAGYTAQTGEQSFAQGSFQK